MADFPTCSRRALRILSWSFALITGAVVADGFTW
uniref:Uncharacterized protein n=1 Tax=Noctiluca scintillans TaxID=2966 RepID=A7WQB8_NOCSC|nr:unknown [Noctiluca scintillans]